MKGSGNMLVKEIFIDMMEKQKSNWAKIIQNSLKELDLNNL